MIYIAAFVLALGYLIAGGPGVLAALWWMLLLFVVVCGLVFLAFTLFVLAVAVEARSR